MTCSGAVGETKSGPAFCGIYQRKLKGAVSSAISFIFWRTLSQGFVVLWFGNGAIYPVSGSVLSTRKFTLWHISHTATQNCAAISPQKLSRSTKKVFNQLVWIGHFRWQTKDNGKWRNKMISSCGQLYIRVKKTVFDTIILLCSFASKTKTLMDLAWDCTYIL